MPRRAEDGATIAARLRTIIEDRGLRVRDVVLRMGPELRGTAYLTLQGKTADTRTSTLVAFCNAIGADPDDVLDWTATPLPTDLQGLWEDVHSLSDDDKRLAVKVIRSVSRTVAVGE